MLREQGGKEVALSVSTDVVRDVALFEDGRLLLHTAKSMKNEAVIFARTAFWSLLATVPADAGNHPNAAIVLGGIGVAGGVVALGTEMIARRIEQDAQEMLVFPQAL